MTVILIVMNLDRYRSSRVDLCRWGFKIWGCQNKTTSKTSRDLLQVIPLAFACLSQLPASRERQGSVVVVFCVVADTGSFDVMCSLGRGGTEACVGQLGRGGDRALVGN